MRFLVEYRFVLSLALSAVVGVRRTPRVAVSRRQRVARADPGAAADALRGLLRTRTRPVVQHAVLRAERRVLVPVHLRRALGSADDVRSRCRRIPRRRRARISSSCSASSIARRRRSARASRRWLSIPERGLYTGMAIVGAIGTGKTSACMYPYVEQLLGYRASDPAREVGGLVLEVKGDFCTHVRDMLARHGRADDYVEVSLTSPYRYNPLHNDLDAYALAYGIATLMTNLFGAARSRSGSRRARTWSSS